jgi:aryl-alcohol dehydrogenase-like predicted oxidoreductase
VNSHYKPNCSFAAGLNRREFNGLCAALGSSLHAVISTASAIAATTGSDSNDRGRTVKFHDGTIVPALGQGSAQLAQGRHPEAVEEEALRTGLSLGMTLIDTAEVYGNGRSEELIGRVIAGQRAGAGRDTDCRQPYRERAPVLRVVFYVLRDYSRPSGPVP